jgi:hypothetical protein
MEPPSPQFSQELGQLGRYSYGLWFSARQGLSLLHRAQTDFGAHLASYTMGTGTISRRHRGRGVKLTTRLKKWRRWQNVDLYIHFPYVSTASPANLILLDLIILITLGEEYKLWTPSLCSPLQPSVTSPLLGPNILLSTLPSNTLGSSFNDRGQISQPYRITDKIIVCKIQFLRF